MIPDPLVIVRKCDLKPIIPLDGAMNSNLTLPLPSDSMLWSSAFLGPSSSITEPWCISSTSITICSKGSWISPSTSFWITWGLEMPNSKPSLLIVSINTDKCNSPLPETINLSGDSPWTTFRATFDINSLSSLSFIFLEEGAQIVSEIFNLSIPVIQTIEPASASVTSTLSKPS